MIVKTKSGRGEKLHIMVDGDYWATTQVDYWYSLGISEGADLTDEELAVLAEKLSTRRMYDKALSLLSARDYCRKELSDKLIRKAQERNRSAARDFGVTDASFSSEELASQKADLDSLRAQAAAVCDKLEDLGLLDDERYARTYAAELVRNKHLSARGVRTALLQKGVRRDIVSLVVEDLSIDPVESIRELLRTKYRTRDLSDPAQKRRTINALQRLGYTYSDISRALDE